MRMRKYPIIYDPLKQPPLEIVSLAEVMMTCRDCMFSVTDSQSHIERARKIIEKHQRERHPAAKKE